MSNLTHPGALLDIDGCTNVSPVPDKSYFTVQVEEGVSQQHSTARVVAKQAAGIDTRIHGNGYVSVYIM